MDFGGGGGREREASEIRDRVNKHDVYIMLSTGTEGTKDVMCRGFKV